MVLRKLSVKYTCLAKTLFYGFERTSISMMKGKHFFSIWVFFHEHARITGFQGKREGISVTPHYHFHPLYRRLGIGRATGLETGPIYMFDPTSMKTNYRIFLKNNGLNIGENMVF